MTQKDECGVVDFRLKDGKGSVLPMFIGEFETIALLNSIAKKETVILAERHFLQIRFQTRPMTHDMMRNTLRLLGFEARLCDRRLFEGVCRSHKFM